MRGEAEELLGGLDWEAVDYENAWKTLEDQYGGDERFIKHQFEIMRDLRPVRTTEEFFKLARHLNFASQHWKIQNILKAWKQAYCIVL